MTDPADVTKFIREPAAQQALGDGWISLENE